MVSWLEMVSGISGFSHFDEDVGAGIVEDDRMAAELAIGAEQQIDR